MWGNFAIVNITNSAYMRRYIFSSVRFFRGSNSENLPKWVDWRKTSVTDPIDQKQSEACWSISAVHAVEGIVQIKTGKLEPLSVQELLDCCPSSHSKGGFIKEAFQHIKDSGITSEKNYSFRACKSRCRSHKFPAVARITSFKGVPANEDDLLKAVANQPVSAAISIPKDFGLSGSRILCSHNPRRTTHYVTIVGYGEENGMKFWLIKNSYGKQWGEKGYFKLQRDVSDLYHGMCHIASAAWIPHIDLKGKNYDRFVKKSNRIVKIKKSQGRRKMKKGGLSLVERKMVNWRRVASRTFVSFTTSLNRDAVDLLCNELLKMCKSRGMSSTPSSVVPVRQGWPNEIEKVLCDIQWESGHLEKLLQRLVIILPDVTGSYGKIKRISAFPEKGEIISDVVHGGMMREWLRAFSRFTILKHDRIVFIFFSDGVGECQISVVLYHELDAIHKVAICSPVSLVLFQSPAMERDSADASSSSGRGTQGCKC